MALRKTCLGGSSEAGEEDAEFDGIEASAFRGNATAGVAFEMTTITQLETAESRPPSTAASIAGSPANSSPLPRRPSDMEDSAAEDDDPVIQAVYDVPDSVDKNAVLQASCDSQELDPMLRAAAGDDEDLEGGSERPPHGKEVAEAGRSEFESATILMDHGTGQYCGASFSGSDDTDPDRPESSATAVRRATRRAVAGSRMDDTAALSDLRPRRVPATVELTVSAPRRRSNAATSPTSPLKCFKVVARLERHSTAAIKQLRSQLAHEEICSLREGWIQGAGVRTKSSSLSPSSLVATASLSTPSPPSECQDEPASAPEDAESSTQPKTIPGGSSSHPSGASSVGSASPPEPNTSSRSEDGKAHEQLHKLPANGDSTKEVAESSAGLPDEGN